MKSLSASHQGGHGDALALMSRHPDLMLRPTLERQRRWRVALGLFWCVEEDGRRHKNRTVGVEGLDDEIRGTARACLSAMSEAAWASTRPPEPGRASR
jgi:hypothetical protein